MAGGAFCLQFLPSGPPPLSFCVKPLAPPMPKAHRYTGDFPPIEVIAQFPNWDYALDEEGEPGQDETTMRPEAEQTFITEWTGFSAADVVLASGEQFTGLVEVISARVRGVNVFESPGTWRVHFHKPSGMWQPFVEQWLPEGDRVRSVALSDSRVFPLRVATRLALGRGGQQWRVFIQPDGSERAWT